MKRKKPKKTPTKRTHVKAKSEPKTRTQMGKAARDKGKRGERAAAKLWSDQGYKAYRTAQVEGLKGTSDIIVDGVSGTFFLEVKNTEAFSCFPVLNRAKSDCGPIQTPVIMHTRNEQPFVVVLAAEDFINLVKRAGFVPPPVEDDYGVEL